MPISTSAIRGRNHARIGEVLHRNAEAIIEEWSRRALEQGHGRPGAHRSELRDHLPEFLRALGENLAGKTTHGTDSPSQQALEHGRFRWQVGWELEDVVVDYQLLQVVILQSLRKTLGRDPNLDEIIAIGVHIDDAIAKALSAYVEHQAGQLQQAHQRLKEFLSVLGHELRNPLGTITVGLQLARLSCPPQGDLADAIDGIHKGVGTMTRLMDDMLDIARITRGDLELRPRRVLLNEIVEAAVSSTRPILTERHHHLNLSITQEALPIDGDATRLEQVMINLVTNAAKYTDPGGAIEVTADREADQAILRVIDNGSGIDPEFLPSLFDLFAQAPQHHGRGLGIGLALVRSLIERHGGTISAQSDGPGKGSTFTVRLPLADQPSSDGPLPKKKTPTASSQAAEPRRILVVDDEQDAARLLGLLLEQDGHEVRVVFDGSTALAEAETMQPDLILLDLGLPDLNGAEVARRLRSSFHLDHLLIVALTGYSPNQQATKTSLQHDPSFDHFLTKPVEADSLSHILSLRNRLTDNS